MLLNFLFDPLEQVNDLSMVVRLTSDWKPTGNKIWWNVRFIYAYVKSAEKIGRVMMRKVAKQQEKQD